MKKQLAVLLLGMMAVGFMTSCGSGNSPSAVVKKNIECIKNKDAKGVVELTYLDDIANSPEDLEEAKAQFLSMLQEGAFESLEEKGGVKSFEILNEDVSDNPEPGSIAFVTVKTVYGNGEEYENKVKTVMDKNGKWKVALGN